MLALLGGNAAHAAVSTVPPACTPIPTAPTAQLSVGGMVQDCNETPALVYIPGGTFEMGDLLGDGYSYERPAHDVSVHGFLMGRYDVTVAEWQACTRAGACRDNADGTATGPGYPVTEVSWYDAMDYVKWISTITGKPYRLPSEAEWEYAARAGSPDQYPWGNNENVACQHANLFDEAGRARFPAWHWAVGCNDGYAMTSPVGHYPPNAWGLYDMVGDVWEWLADCWHANYDGAPGDGSAWVEPDCTKHVNRGGGWGNHPRSARVSARDGDLSSGRSDGMGFRVARDRVPSDPPVMVTPARAASVAPPAVSSR